MVTARLDGKGRISIPSKIREDMGLEPGDVVFFDMKDSVLRVAKANNPFDALIEEALEELHAGHTVSLRDFARSEGLESAWLTESTE